MSWHRIWLVLTMAAREQAGREAQPSAGIVEARASTPKPAARRASMPVRTSRAASAIWSPTPLGLPLAFAEHPADIQDRDGPWRAKRGR